MKKQLLAMGMGLFATSAVAQVTFPVKMGFEDADKTTKYCCKYANTVGKSQFGDWVNPKDEDSWEEQSREAAKNGDYGFLAKNDAKGNPWDRGFKLGNLPIQEGKSYRMSFWVKGKQGQVMKAYISKGVEQLDKSFVNPSGDAVYGLNGQDDYTLANDDWQHVSFVAFNHGAEPFNNVLSNTSWMGGAVVGDCVDKSLWEAAGINESNKDKTYREFWNGTIPEIYFAIINAYDGGEFMIDDILVEEDKTFNQATFNNDVIRLDFGYATNISKLASAAKNNCLILDKSQFKVNNGSDVEIYSVEAHTDGYVYIFLANSASAEGATVSFTPNEDCPLEYGENKRPSNSTDALKVFGFSNEVVYEDENIIAEAHFSTLPQLVSSTPEEGSFDLESIKDFTFIFDADVDIANSSAVLKDEEGKEVATLDIAAGADSKTMLATYNGGKLKNGTYTVSIEAANKSLDASYIDVTITIGQTGFNPDNASETMFDAAFDEDSDGTAPKNGLMVSGDEGGTNMTPGEGRGSGPRVFNTGSESQLYLRNWSGSNYYYEVGSRLIKESEEDPGTPELTLQPGTNKLTFKYAMWKQGEQTLKVEVYPVEFDEDGNVVYGENIAEESFTQNYDVNGDKTLIKNAPAGELKFEIETEGTYGVRFQGSGEYLIADVVIDYVPNIAGIESKTKLWNAIKEAYDYFYTNDYTENDRYNVIEFTDLEDVLNKYTDDGEPGDWIKLGLNSPSSYDKATQEVKDALANATEFKEYVDAYDALRIEGSIIEQVLAKNEETKYANIQYYKDLKNLYEQYKDQALTNREQLKNVTEELKSKYYLLSMSTGVGIGLPSYNTLTWELVGKVGIPALTARTDMGAETLKKMAGDDLTDEEANVLLLAEEALTDNDDIANALKKLVTARYYKAMQNEETAKAFFTAKEAEFDEEGNEIAAAFDGVYNMSFFLKNPNIYVKTSSTKNNHASSLDAINIGTEEEPVTIYQGSACPGWTISEGSAGWSNGWGSLAWNEEIAEEAMASNWGGAFTISQKITDLPAGLYILKTGTTERNGSSDATDAESLFFWQTSGDIENEDRVGMMIPSSGQAWKTDNISSARRDAEYDTTGNEVTPEDGSEFADAEPIEIVDGVLNIGVHAGPSSHVFINNFSLYLVGNTKTFNYKENEFWTGIDKATSKLVNVTVYDLNGRQKYNATKGVNIVKRTYSDGTVKTSKCIVK